MNKLFAAVVTVGLSVSLAQAEFSVSADVASAYVFRGATINDGYVVQPAVDAFGFGLPEGFGSFAAGAWGNYNLEDNTYAGAQIIGSQFSETDWYASYDLPPFIEGLAIYVGYTEYTYKNDAVTDKEANAGVGYEIAGITLNLAGYYMVGGDNLHQTYGDLSAEYTWEFSDALAVVVGASAGYMIQGDHFQNRQDGFNEGVADATLRYSLTDQWSFGASISYITQLDEAVFPEAEGAYDVDLVTMLSASYEL